MSAERKNISARRKNFEKFSHLNYDVTNSDNYDFQHDCPIKPPPYHEKYQTDKLYFDDAAPYNDVSTPPSLSYDVRNYENNCKSFNRSHSR